MKKLRLIAVRSQREEILRELLLLGCVEIREPPAELPEDAPACLRRADGTEAAPCRAERAKLLNALRVLDRYAPEKKGLLTPRPEVELATLLDESALAEDLRRTSAILELDEEVRRISAEESRERAAREALLPWQSLDMPLEQTGTERCSVTLGTLPAAAEIVAAQEALAAAAPEAELLEISADTTAHFLLLLVWREEAEAALTALRPLGWSAANLTGLRGTPEANLRAGAKRLDDLAVRKSQLAGEIVAHASCREALQLGVDTLNTRISRAECAERLLDTESAFTFEGWLTAPDEQRLGAALSKYDCAWETSEPDPEHPEEVPVKLASNRLTRPYNLVTEMYSLPAYNGLDPNPFIMPFFALFFGIMFADMAYGLILLAAGLLITYKARPHGSMKYMAGLLIQCGITTFVMGFLTGSLFGNAVPIFGAMFGKTWAVVPHLGTIHVGSASIDLPLDLLSGQNPLYVLIGAMCLGVVHLALGVGIGIYLKIRDGQWVEAILCDLSWWIIFAGLAVKLLGGGKVLLYVGIGMMVLGAVLTHKGFGRVTGILSAVYSGVTGYLGDVLSYSRLMALMLAGSVIASVFNQLGALGGGTVGGVILFIIVFCIGHTLNFALNLIGCFVHTMRLQFLEFFGKWYRDGGKAFRPLNIQTKFVDIKEEI